MNTGAAVYAEEMELVVVVWEAGGAQAAVRLGFRASVAPTR